MPSPVRNYKKEYKSYHAAPAQKKNRATRNTARRQAEASGQVHKGDGKDVDHKVPLSKGGSNTKANRRVVKASTNRSYARTKKGAIK